MNNLLKNRGGKMDDLDKILEEYERKNYPYIGLEDVGKEGLLINFETIEFNNNLKIKIYLDIDGKTKTTIIPLHKLAEWKKIAKVEKARGLIGKKVRIFLSEVFNPSTKQFVKKAKVYLIEDNKVI